MSDRQDDRQGEIEPADRAAIEFFKVFIIIIGGLVAVIIWMLL